MQVVVSIVGEGVFSAEDICSANDGVSIAAEGVIFSAEELCFTNVKSLAYAKTKANENRMLLTTDDLINFGVDLRSRESLRVVMILRTRLAGRGPSEEASGLVAEASRRRGESAPLCAGPGSNLEQPTPPCNMGEYGISFARAW